MKDLNCCADATVFVQRICYFEFVERKGLLLMAFLQHIGPQAGLAFGVTAALTWMGLVFALSKLLRDMAGGVGAAGSARRNRLEVSRHV